MVCMRAYADDNYYNYALSLPLSLPLSLSPSLPLSLPPSPSRSPSLSLSLSLPLPSSLRAILTNLLTRSWSMWRRGQWWRWIAGTWGCGLTLMYATHQMICMLECLSAIECLVTELFSHTCKPIFIAAHPPTPTHTTHPHHTHSCLLSRWWTLTLWGMSLSMSSTTTLVSEPTPTLC